MKLLLTIIFSILGVVALCFGLHFLINYFAKKKYLKTSNDVLAADEHGATIVSKYDNYVTTVGGYVFLVAICCSTLFPFVWMFINSLKTPAEIVLIDSVFPSAPQWQNYATAWERLQILTGLKNTLLIILGAVPASLFVSALVAFAFEKMHLRHKTFWLLFLMSGLMIPGAATLLPTYRIYFSLNLTDTLWPFILPAWFGSVSLVFFFVQYMKSVPSELFEASKIDGAGYFKSFVTIMLPNIKLPMLCQGVFAFVGHWNEFFTPQLYLTSDSNKTLQVFLYALGDSGSDKPLLFAGAFMTCIPLFVVYLSFQKFFVGSIAVSGIKG